MHSCTLVYQFVKDMDMNLSLKFAKAAAKIVAGSAFTVASFGAGFVFGAFASFEKNADWDGIRQMVDGSISLAGAGFKGFGSGSVELGEALGLVHKL